MGNGPFSREIDGYHRWMFSRIIELFNGSKGLPLKEALRYFDSLEVSLSPGIVRDRVLMQDPDREYFEFAGGNTFSWRTQNFPEDQKENLYKMIVDNVINGNLIPKQPLPTLYHNLILAEAIKGNRRDSVIRYLELCKSEV